MSNHKKLTNKKGGLIRHFLSLKLFIQASGIILMLTGATFLIATGCKSNLNEVTVYCTVDQVFSQPVLNDFEGETGIKVNAVYDAEETKSTGVMNRLIAEKDNARCDLFWSGDPLRNGILQTKGITEPYQSEQTLLIPDYFKEKNNHWIGFSSRARVLIYNKTLIASDCSWRKRDHSLSSGERNGNSPNQSSVIAGRRFWSGVVGVEHWRAAALLQSYKAGC